jgi:hypothetical protein
MPPIIIPLRQEQKNGSDAYLQQVIQGLYADAQQKADAGYTMDRLKYSEDQTNQRQASTISAQERQNQYERVVKEITPEIEAKGIFGAYFDNPEAVTQWAQLTGRMKDLEPIQGTATKLKQDYLKSIESNSADSTIPTAIEDMMYKTGATRAQILNFFGRFATPDMPDPKTPAEEAKTTNVSLKTTPPQGGTPPSASTLVNPSSTTATPQVPSDQNMGPPKEFNIYNPFNNQQWGNPQQISGTASLLEKVDVNPVQDISKTIQSWAPPTKTTQAAALDATKALVRGKPVPTSPVTGVSGVAGQAATGRSGSGATPYTSKAYEPLPTSTSNVRPTSTTYSETTRPQPSTPALSTAATTATPISTLPKTEKIQVIANAVESLPAERSAAGAKGWKAALSARANQMVSEIKAMDADTLLAAYGNMGKEINTARGSEAQAKYMKTLQDQTVQNLEESRTNWALTKKYWEAAGGFEKYGDAQAALKVKQDELDQKVKSLNLSTAEINNRRADLELQASRIALDSAQGGTAKGALTESQKLSQVNSLTDDLTGLVKSMSDPKTSEDARKGLSMQADRIAQDIANLKNQRVEYTKWDPASKKMVSVSAIPLSSATASTTAPKTSSDFIAAGKADVAAKKETTSK